tara:strand:+ start:403 stop:552 length:150 start_codon:yes stop_codon:yes gene_type:complete
MPPKKFNKKKLFYKKTLVISAINSIVIQCKVNNNLLNCGKKYPYLTHEK